MEVEQRVVSAVGISVSTIHGLEAQRRMEAAMTQAVLDCNAEGLSAGDDAHAAIIRDRMMAAHDAVLADVQQEQAGLLPVLQLPLTVEQRMTKIENLLQQLLEKP